MCPDSQILSIYFDDELPSPWKEKMEAHLAACPKCKEKFANYQRVHNILRQKHTPLETAQKRTIVENEGKNPVITENDNEELLAKSQEKVWSRLASIKRHNTEGLVRHRGNIRGYSLWRRKLSIPLPAVAAAAILIIIGAFVFLQNGNSKNISPNNQITESPYLEYPNFIEELPPNFIPTAQDMNSVLQYLDASGADVIILQIPESKNFSRSGEPAIIRAADYSNNDRPNRRRQP